jgi:hypothetical protein
VSAMAGLHHTDPTPANQRQRATRILASRAWLERPPELPGGFWA